MTAIFRSNGLDTTRFLFCTDRGIKRAVDRNRIKRIIRDFVARHNHPIGLDIAYIARLDFDLKKFPEREKISLKLLDKIKK